MPRKFKVYLDSGANIHSCYEQVVTLEELGYSDEEWDALSEETQSEIMKEIAWECMEWGFHEIEGGENDE